MPFDSQSKRHPIGAVARQTGLKPDLIRAWESRYEAVCPERTPTGRRLYSTDDIERLLLLKEASSTGRSISHVADLSSDELRELLLEVRNTSIRQATDEGPEPGGHEDEAVGECLLAIEHLDALALKRHLDRCCVQLSRVTLLEDVVTPLVRQVGERWKAGQLRPVHEHLLTPVMRLFLMQLREADHVVGSAPGLVVTTPIGQRHELGALMAAASASAEGWRVIYLGPELPASEMVTAVETTGSSVLALSIVYPPDDPALIHEIRTAYRLLPSGVRMVLGGRGSDAYRRALEGLDIEHFSCLAEFRVFLERIRAAGHTLSATAEAV